MGRYAEYCPRVADLQGLASLDALHEKEGVSNLYQVLHDFQSSTLLDRIVGNPPFGLVLGIPKSRVTSPSLNSTVNLANPQSYDDLVASNGADYVPLQNAGGQFLRGRDLRSLKFEGARTTSRAAATVDRRQQRPRPTGQPGAVVGQPKQPRRRRSYPGHRAGK